MRIISSSEPEPVAETKSPAFVPVAPEPVEPPRMVVPLEVHPADDGALKNAMAEFKEQAEHQSQEIVRLTSEIAGLRRALEDMRQVQEYPVREAPPTVPERQDLLKAIADMQSSMDQPPAADVPPVVAPKKVAFIRKLWDYLNQTAFVIPSGK